MSDILGKMATPRPVSNDFKVEVVAFAQEKSRSRRSEEQVTATRSEIS